MSPVAVSVARVAVAQGVVVGELRSDVALRSRLVLAAGESRLSDLEWSQVAAMLTEEMRRVARASSKDAGECQKCGQPVRWVETSTGSRMPLDPLPHPWGNVEIRPSGWVMVALVHGNHELPLGEKVRAFRSHFATCSRRQTARSRRSLAAVPQDPPPLCVVCKLPMDRVLYSLGERDHPTCGGGVGG